MGDAAGLLPEQLLAYAARGPDWAAWLDRLPRLLTDLVDGWELAVTGEGLVGHTALVLPVRQSSGQPAALKVGFPHRESEHEHLVLRAWAGEGAVRLLRADPRRSALLLEWADAGRDLHALDVVAACEVVAGLYGRLHLTRLPQLDRLSEQAARWAQELPDLRTSRLVPRRFVDQAAGLAADFAADAATDAVLVHTDLHYANVLAATREPWLVIDPKPLAGDPAYEVAPLLWNRWDEAVATGDVRAAVLERLYTVVDVAGLDEERARAWVVVREVVNMRWALTNPAEVDDPDWLTAAMTIVKAVQPGSE